jgi:predicted transcriptional regulator
MEEVRVQAGRSRGQHEAEEGRREHGALEAEVMATLWAEAAPMTAGAVQAVLGARVAYKTVLTVLARLHAKGLLEREQQGRAHAYTPLRPGGPQAAAQMATTLAHSADRAQALQHFVDALDSTEQELLRALLDEPG